MHYGSTFRKQPGEKIGIVKAPLVDAHLWPLKGRTAAHDVHDAPRCDQLASNCRPQKPSTAQQQHAVPHQFGLPISRSYACA